ncbi:MAG: GNAT family N-acyltransferase [bacterium]
MQTTQTLDCPVIPSTGWAVPGKGITQIATRFMGGIFQLDRLSGMYDDMRSEDASRSFVDRALARLDVSYDINRGSLDAIPREGSLLVVANHPFGGVEGLVLLSLLSAVRPDIKVMANSILSAIPELQKHMILVDPFGGSEAAAKNLAPIRQSLRWLRNGGVLGMFPAGEVAHLDLARRRVCESNWHGTVARLMRHSGAAVLPVFFEGVNGPLFQMAGMIHPRLRTAMLIREMVNKAGRPLKVGIGKVLPYEKLNAITDDAELTQYLKLRVQLLGEGGVAARKRQTVRARISRSVPVITAGVAGDLIREVGWLPPEQKLVEAGDYRVYVAGAKQIPSVLREIARLREVTFRAVGEGTGAAWDMDVFDRFYQHLFVWNVKKSEVVGAYRLGLTDKILAQLGLGGLYTSTLFKYQWDLIGKLSPAIEIGRSFVRQEYQRKHLPLLLLWKGIGAFVARNPKYRNLFGTVSMSNSYQETSRQLVVRFFDQDKNLLLDWQSVCPRNPMKMKANSVNGGNRPACRIPDLEALSEIVSDIEPDGKGIPVLLRQYLKLGGRVLACNVDPKFNMSLDALLVVDLTQADSRLLEIYMGDSTAGYLRHHGIETAVERQVRCA